MSLQRFLADHPRVRVIGAATSGRDGVTETVRLRPDLVLLDLVMPEMTGLEALQWIKAALEPPRVVVLTFGDEPEFRDRALALGADGFVTKAETARHLLPAVEALFPQRGGEGVSEFGTSECAESIFATAREAFVLLDEELRVRAANRAFYDTFRVTPAETEGRVLYELCAGLWDVPALRRLLEEVIPRDGQARDFEVEHDLPPLGRRTMLLNARRVSQAGGTDWRIFLAIEDVTERYQARAEARHLADVIRSSEDAIIGKTLDSTITSWNPAAERLYGWTAAEAVGRPITLIVPADRWEELGGIRERLLRGERVQHHETQRVRRDGSRIDVSLTVSAVRDATGQLVGVSIIARDITDRKRAEADLRVSEGRYRVLVESIPHLVWMARPDGLTDFMNRRGADHFGVPPDAISGWGWLDLLHPADVPRAREAWEAAVRGGTPYRIEYRIRQPDGSHRWYLSQGAAVRGPDGRVEKWVGTWTDIDDRFRAEADLRRTSALLTAVAEGTTDAVFVKDRDGVYLLCNAAAAGFVGRTAAEMTGRTDADLFDPESARLVRDRDLRVMAGGRAVTEEEELTAAGVTRTYLATKAPYRDAAGAVVGVVGISRDMTDRKRLEEQQRASEARFRALVENSWDGVTLLDADGVIRYASPATARVLGYAPEEYVGRSGAEFVHPDDLPAAAEVLAGVASAPGGSAILSYRYRHKNGSWLRVETAATNLLDDPQVRAVVLNSRDVTAAVAAGEALRRSEEQYRALAESIPQLVWVSRPEGTPEFFNRQWLEYTGLTTGESLGEGRRQAVHPDDRPGAVEWWERSLRTGEPYSREYRLRRADGTYRWHLGRALPVRDGRGEVVRWVGTATDIHDHRQAEEERSRLARHIRLLLESTGEGIYGLDHEGRCTFINRAGAAMLGYTPEELLGREMHSVIHLHRPGGATYPTDECPIHTAFREGRGVRVEDESFWRKDGTAFPVSYTSYPAAEGGFRGAVVTFQDVTERRRAEEERETFVALVEHSADFIAMADLDGRVLYVNPGGRRMVGLDPAAEVRGQRIDEFVPPDVAALYRETAIPRALAGAPWVGEARFTQFKTGQLLDMQQCVFVVRKPGGREPLCLATVARDVTGAKRLEEQYRHAQKMEAIGQLAGGIAHDFNNLLTIINGYADLLLQSLPTADPSRDLLTEIHRAGERSAGLTRQLLAFSRRQVLAPRVLDLNAAVADTETMLRRLIGEDVRLATAPWPGLWPVRADPGQVEQVLLNLVVNARDAMPTGGRLTIETRNVELDDEYARTHPGARPGPHALLAVSDTGHGMSDEVRAKIFEPFFTTKGPGKGTGLGLATVYGIVTQSGGHVGVYSEAGVGTTFKVYLPRAAGPVGGSKLRSGVLAPPRGAETVLLVEDDPGVRALTRHILAGCGYTVLEAGDGDEAMHAADLHAGPIHLLVTDVVMPGGGGRAVAERLLARHPGLKVLYVSGYTDDAVVRHGVLTEQANFLQKPFTPITLAVKVREVLDQPK